MLFFCCGSAQTQQLCAPTTLERPAAFFKGMVAWWPATGSATCLQPGCLGYNDIIGGNNGTPMGGVTFAAGEVGPAFGLNGSVGTFIDIGNPASLNISGPITVDAWVKPNLVNAYQAIYSQMSTANNLGEVQLRINGDTGGFDWFRRNAQGSVSTEGVTTSIGAVAGGWQHVAAAYDGSAYYIYINGVLVNNPCSYCFEYVALQGPDTKIGSGDSGDNMPFNGLMDEVQVFNRALSASEIQAISNAGSAGVCPQARFARPTLMGVSVGNTTGTTSPPCSKTSPCSETGTAGLLVHSVSNSSQKFILSNSHILGSVGSAGCPNTAIKGTTATLQPGTADIGKDPGNVARYHIGTVADFTTLNPQPATNSVDAAISQTDLAHATSEIFGIGQPSPVVGTATPGDIVVKSGRTTGVTVGTIASITMMPFSIATGCGRYTYDAGQIMITSASSGPFSVGGDSGSVILDSATLTPVGLLFAGNANNSLANQISAVYTALNVFPDSPSVPGPKTVDELKAMVIESSTRALDPDLRRVEEIATRHGPELLAISGIQGVGVGLADNGHGFAIHVYVIKRTLELQNAIPKQIEGAPVQLFELGGELKAL